MSNAIEKLWESRFCLRLIQVLALACVPVLLYAPYLLDLRFLPHDTLDFLYPWRAFLSDSLHQGIFPFWDSFNSPGFPITFLSGPAYYPLSVILNTLFVFSYKTFVFEIIFTAAIGMICTYFWLRRWGASRVLSFGAATAYIGSPVVFTSSIQSYTMGIPAHYLPCLLLGAHLVGWGREPYQRPLGTLLIVLAAWSMVTGGYTAVVWPFMVFSAIYLWLCLRTGDVDENGLALRRLLLWGVSAVLVVFLLVFLPLTELWTIVRPVIAELRGLETWFDPFAKSLVPESALTVFLPNGGYLKGVRIGLGQMYIGAILALGILPALICLRLQRQEKVMLLMALMVYLAALGSESPVAWLFTFGVPGVNFFRLHALWGSFAVFMLVTVSVLLLGRVLAADLLLRRRYLRYVMITVIIICSLALLLTQHQKHWLRVTVFDVVTLGMWAIIAVAVGVAILVYTMSRDDKPYAELRLCGIIGVVLMIGILTWWGISSSEIGIRFARFLARGSTQIAPLLVSGGDVALLHGTVDVLAPYQLLLLDLAQIIAITSIFTFVLLRTSGRRLMTACVVLLVFDVLVVSQLCWIGKPSWLGQRPFDFDTRVVQHLDPQRLEGGPNLPLFQDRRPYVRTKMPLFDPAINSFGQSDIGSRLLSKVVWFIPGERELDGNTVTHRAIDVPFRQFHLSPNRLNVTFTSPENGWLLWTDAWAEGWSATVNNKSIKVEKLLGMLKGVRVSAGECQVVFKYRPPYLLSGLAAMAIGLIAIVSLALRSLWLYRLPKACLGAAGVQSS